jgi:hypothetical protein
MRPLNHPPSARPLPALWQMQRITGDILGHLSEEHLKELGVIIIGERVALMQAIGKFRHRAVNRKRFRTIWESDAQLYRDGPCGWIQMQCCCVACCEDVDHYKLTGMHRLRPSARAPPSSADACRL